MYVLIASLPILFCLVAMSIFNWGAIKSIFYALVITIVVAIWMWHISIIDIVSYGLLGIFEAFNIAVIIFGAILLLSILTQVGAMKVITNSFNNISRDQRVQILLIGFIFNGFLCGIAAFGSEIALSVLVLIALGLPAFPAAVVTLLFNGPLVTFGAVGVPTTTAAAYTKGLVEKQGGNAEQYVQNVIEYSAFLHTIAGVFLAVLVMFLVIRIFAKDKSWKSFFEILPFTIFSSVALMIPFYLSARYIGAETPVIIGAIVGLFIVIGAIKMGFLIPKNVWSFPPRDKWPKDWSPQAGEQSIDTNQDHHLRKVSFLSAWFPYIFASLLLIITRIPNTVINKFFNEPAIVFSNLFGLEKVSYTFKWLYSPGIMPFIFISIICVIFYRMNFKDIGASLKSTYSKSKVAIIALFLAVMMVKIMQGTDNNSLHIEGMLTSIALSLANLQGVGSIISAPIIGALGAFVSGSNTTSNILFSVVQFNVATILHIPQYILVALQSVGGGVGVTFCIKNLAIASSVTGLKNSEGRFIKYVLSIGIIYIVILLAIVFSSIYIF